MKRSKIIIAGPCAVESEEQVFTTAKELFESFSALESDSFDFRFFRCGIWKPRTNPNDFQGIGNNAFSWLPKIKDKFGFKICVEVASAQHVRLCIANNIDAVWIGARTTVNPFIVQEIADAIQHASLTVLVKNPINPDINLWIGAIQRFQNAGIKNVMAIHRGFSIANENVYRYAPCWEIPIALKIKLPDIPILCDISHIAGNLSLQQILAQTAINYGFDGIMAEVHYAPEKALSDSKQQLLPSQFIDLLQTITFSHFDTPADHALFIQRNLMKNIDIQISRLLSERMKIVDKIAAIKAKSALPLLQREQWERVVSIYEENALEDENYRQFLDEFLLLLHKSSLKRQE
jgi:chorismate mutase